MAALVASQVLFVAAIKSGSTAEVFFLMSLAPLMAAVLARPLLGEHIGIFGMSAIAVALGGVALMSGLSFNAKRHRLVNAGRPVVGTDPSRSGQRSPSPSIRSLHAARAHALMRPWSPSALSRRSFVLHCPPVAWSDPLPQVAATLRSRYRTVPSSGARLGPVQPGDRGSSPASRW